MSFIVIIPSRYQSSRLPGKPLVDICGKTMIQRVAEQALQSGASRVVIATDDVRIEQAVTGLGYEVCMTSPDHNSGTERLAEVCSKLGFNDDDIIVNVQGDEPLIPPRIIEQVAKNLGKQSEARMATLSVAITDVEEVFNPNAVKVVTDKQGYALYFSRAPIPYHRDNFMHAPVTEIKPVYQRHIGIYAYRAGFIRDYVQWQETELEQIESLEQLRVLWHGEKIHVEEALEAPAAGVDTPEDLVVVRNIVSAQCC
ncbi:3-deoxy-manno-octulosonate cytidylyltransferase [Moritella sp. F3]|uniref:3-deoxy-manno-octulosonate cytidylyltransferase n=1 Tax=Moritella sp. F3 TaxID=2718882 RepID=UPI0018E1842C|nr:3-deoxy-manno-octulosonate cytidylyltransferase [Moritella sp. F3]GIC77469.1 3-deoxy-manno-octulosonate cytidylyltransferase [Moritella sp. F1]GIC79930.1 3-deoxy-manno-octulosonate cytidylyltransferase [Moritella sp. F3]